MADIVAAVTVDLAYALHQACVEVKRRIDAAADVAFLAMDLAYRGHAELAELFLGRYAEASDDYDLYRVRGCHQCGIHRCCRCCCC